jgi:mannose/fructose-specific phosphotransferase system component IIA
MTKDVVGIVVTHGSLGKELVRTAESILGAQDGVEILSNTGASVEGLATEVHGVVQRHPCSVIYLLVDLLGGSCGYVCQEVRRLRPDAVIFSGINLPMLLEFFHHRGRVELPELRERLVSRGRDGIRSL